MGAARSDPYDTIVAISTPPGEGGIGIVRISGPSALSILARIFKPLHGAPGSLESHRLYRGIVIDPHTQTTLDEALAAFMKGPGSYSGEDLVELSCHGSPAVLSRVVTLAVDLGARLAARGEFTKRAFLNGRIDISQAEAVIDMIKAKTPEAASFASSQLFKALSDIIRPLREGLLALLAEIEASLDFPGDVEEPGAGRIQRAIKESSDAAHKLLKTGEAGRIFRHGIRTAIVGKPNVGKSSLLNALLRFDRAIVSPHPGTTRDTLEEGLNIRGVPLIITDTAGIRGPSERVEREGVERARAAAAASELIIVVVDVSEAMDENDQAALELASGKKGVVALNKSDKKQALSEGDIESLTAKTPGYRVSALRGDGLEGLEGGIYGAALSGAEPSGGGPLISLRHTECLTRALEALGRAGEGAEAERPADIIAIDIKEALLALGEVTGEELSEEVIDRIFADFCVGK